MYRYFVLKSKNEPIPVRIIRSTQRINADVMPAYQEFNEQQYTYYEQHPEASVLEIWHCINPEPPTPEQLLEEAKITKITEIEYYDVSEEVNGFFLGDNLVWLDKDTRTCLMNTLNSAELIGRDNINIWFSGMYVSLTITEARYMLAELEIYATDCYNVTETHKMQVLAMEDINEVENFDVTLDYPARPSFPLNEIG